MVKRHKIKSCHSTQTFIFEISKPINVSHISVFEKNGYISIPSHIKSGIFYVKGNGLIATAPFNARKINVRCAGSNCINILNSFQSILESIFD